MIALWGIVLGIVVGLVRGGSFDNLGTLHLRGLILVFAALGLQSLIFPTLWWSIPPLSWMPQVWHILSYVLLIVFLFANRKLPQLWGIAAGVMLNIIVISANQGFMPSNLDALAASGYPETAELLARSDGGNIRNIIAMGPDTRLNFLGDWLYLPPWVPFGVSFSPGDLILMIGVFWLIQHAMVVRNTGRS